MFINENYSLTFVTSIWNGNVNNHKCSSQKYYCVRNWPKPDNVVIMMYNNVIFHLNLVIFTFCS